MHTAFQCFGVVGGLKRTGGTMRAARTITVERMFSPVFVKQLNVRDNSSRV